MTLNLLKTGLKCVSICFNLCCSNRDTLIYYQSLNVFCTLIVMQNLISENCLCTIYRKLVTSVAFCAFYRTLLFKKTLMQAENSTLLHFVLADHNVSGSKV